VGDGETGTPAGGDAVHRASVIAAINSMVGGVGVALLAVGIAAAVVLSGLHLLYQQQRAAFLVPQPARASSA
jgi:hypothetical protein